MGKDPKIEQALPGQCSGGALPLKDERTGQEAWLKAKGVIPAHGSIATNLDINKMYINS